MARAIHATKKTKRGAAHVVGVGDLRVMIVPDEGGAFFAQGLEIDYAAQGSSIEDVQQRFEDGLSRTIGEHLKVFGNIKKLLRVAPQEVWAEFFGSPDEVRYEHSQVCAHVLLARTKTRPVLPPFNGIAYYQRQEQMAAV